MQKDPCTFESTLKKRCTARPPPPQLVLPDAALCHIDPASLARAESEWMNGFAALPRSDPTNHVWPMFVNRNNIFPEFPPILMHQQQTTCIFHTAQPKAAPALGYSVM